MRGDARCAQVSLVMRIADGYPRITRRIGTARINAHHRALSRNCTVGERGLALASTRLRRLVGLTKNEAPL